jgi:hypothetical protein
MTTRYSRRASRTTSLVVIVCLVVLQVAGLTPGTRAAGADDLKQIQYKYYFRGKYVEAIESLRVFLARVDLGEAEVLAAREFLAASYVLSGAVDLGKQQFLKILNADEQYAGPDPAVFKPEVIDVYASVRDEMAASRLRMASAGEPGGFPAEIPEKKSSKPIYKKWWFYVGLAAVVVVVGAVSSSEEEKETEKVPAAATGTVTIEVRVP